MDFDDTQPMTQEQFKASSEAMCCMQAKFDEAKLHKEGAMQLHSKQKRQIISSDEEDIDLEQLLEDGQNSKKVKGSKNNMQKDTIRPCSIVLNHLDDILNLCDGKAATNGKQDSDVQNINSVNADNAANKEIKAAVSASDKSKTVTPKINMQNFLLRKSFRQKILRNMQKRQSFKMKLSWKFIVQAKATNKDGWHQITMQ